MVEVKSDLTTGKEGQLTAAMGQCAKLKKLERSRPLNVEFLNHYGDFPSCPFILFAYRGGQADTVISQIETMTAECHLRDMPDLIVVLQHDYVLAKTKGWSSMGATARSVYRQGESNRPALFDLYSFVIGLTDYWTTHPEDFQLPLREYVETLAKLPFMED